MRSRASVAVIFTLGLLGLAGGTSAGCVETRTTQLALYERIDDRPLTSGFQCACSTNSSAPPLLARPARLALVLELIVWDLPGVPQCRAPDQIDHCTEGACRVLDEVRVCRDLELPPRDTGDPMASLERRMAAVEDAVLGMALPEHGHDRGTVRLVGLASDCETLGFSADGSNAEGMATPTYADDELVACATSCPTSFTDDAQTIRLGLTTGPCNEGNLSVCAGNPIDLISPPPMGNCAAIEP